MLNSLSPRPHDPDHPRLQLLLAPRQHRRGPAPHPPHAGPCPAPARRRARAPWPHALARAPRGRASRAPELRAFFAGALISPVLTAHPTEVRRKSTHRPGDGDRPAARRARPRARSRPRSKRRPTRRCGAPSLTLWQTSILRRTRLTVVDEVENGLSYYDYTFLRELPRFYADARGQARGAGDPAWNGTRAAVLPAHGQLDRRRPRRQPVRHRRRAARRRCGCRATAPSRFYLEELHALGAELSLDGRIVSVSDRRCRRWPSARPTAPRTARTSPTGAR